MYPFLDVPADMGGISWRGVPLEIHRGRVWAENEMVGDLLPHGLTFSENQDDGTGETPAAPTLAPGEHVVPPSAASVDHPPAEGGGDQTSDGVSDKSGEDESAGDQQSDGTDAQPPAGGTKVDPSTMDKAALRAFLAEHGQNPGPATGEEKLRAAVVAILAGGE